MSIAKRISLWLIFPLAVVIAITLMYFFGVHQFTVLAANCIVTFGCSPEEFFDKEFDFYETTGDFREKAYIDEDGNLVLCISRKQAKAWRDSEWLSGFPELQDRTDIEISEDFKTLTAYFSPEEYEADNSQEKDALICSIFDKMAFIQMIDNWPQNKVHITYIEKDSVTGEILWSRDLKNDSSEFE